MKIIVDMFGGDNAPQAPLAGSAAAVAQYGVEILAVGDEAKLRAAAKAGNISLDGFTFVQAPGVFDMEDAPTDIVKKRDDTSLAVALHLLAGGGGDALVSAGSTGALMVGSTTFVKRIKGVRRPALAMLLPAKAKVLLLDCGANAECRPEHLFQFGLMGSAYMAGAEGVENPRVGLVNMGAEKGKGTDLQRQAYDLLAADPAIHFVGNIEARDLLDNKVDVAVTDGFTGNAMLKMIEGVAAFMSDTLKEALLSSAKSKIGALLMKDSLRAFKARLDYTEYGGTLFLGISRPVIKAHGSSNAKAFKSAIGQAVKFASSASVDTVRTVLAAGRAGEGGDEA